MMETSKNKAPSAVFELRGKEYNVVAGRTVRASLESVDLNPELHLCVLAGQLITDDCIVKTGEHYRLVAVVSGGGK